MTNPNSDKNYISVEPLDAQQGGRRGLQTTAAQPAGGHREEVRGHG